MINIWPVRYFISWKAPWPWSRRGGSISAYCWGKELFCGHISSALVALMSSPLCKPQHNHSIRSSDLSGSGLDHVHERFCAAFAQWQVPCFCDLYMGRSMEDLGISFCCRHLYFTWSSLPYHSRHYSCISLLACERDCLAGASFSQWRPGKESLACRAEQRQNNSIWYLHFNTTTYHITYQT